MLEADGDAARCRVDKVLVILGRCFDGAVVSCIVKSVRVVSVNRLAEAQFCAMRMLDFLKTWGCFWFFCSGFRAGNMQKNAFVICRYTVASDD